MISFLPVNGTGQPKRRGRARGWLLRGLVGAVLLVLGCDNSSTTGPKATGLIIQAQQLVSGGGGCRLKVILENRVGTDLSGEVVYKLLDGRGVVIGSAAVFPVVPDGETRSATSDFLLAGPGGRRLGCPEIASLQIDPTRTTVPIAST